MKNKKIYMLSFSLAIFLAFTLVSCKGEDISIDLDDFTESALSELEFEDQLEKLDRDIGEGIYHIENAKDSRVFLSSGATAEEVAIFEFEDEKEAKAAEENLEARLEEQEDAFESYNPEELLKLEKAEIRTISNYSILIVSKDENTGDFIKNYK